MIQQVLAPQEEVCILVTRLLIKPLHQSVQEHVGKEDGAPFIHAAKAHPVVTSS